MSCTGRVMPEPRLSDWKRLLMGGAPFGFVFEVVVRFAVTYALLLGLGRLLGKRMSGQVSTLELAMMVLLGAVISAPFEIPNRGIVPAAVLLLCLLGLHRGVAQLGARSARIERWTQAQPSIIVREGRLMTDELDRLGISNEQLFAQFRAHSVKHLGELQRVYLESWGEFSLLRKKPPRSGLCVAPSSDVELQRKQPRDPESLACARCGFVVPRSSSPSRCRWCEFERWEEAACSPPAQP
jgi:uncharacterized membrane protein YcaP (DUF421 family)